MSNTIKKTLANIRKLPSKRNKKRASLVKDENSNISNNNSDPTLFKSHSPKKESIFEVVKKSASAFLESIYPSAFETGELSNDSEVTLGDMHGNVLKGIYFAADNGVMEMSDEDHQRIVELYELPVSELTKEKIEDFKALLDQATYKKDTVAIMRFIGDMLADRGSNDVFTLLMINKLHQVGVPFTILISNHDVEFLMMMYYYPGPYEKSIPTQYPDRNIISPKNSLLNLEMLLDKKIVKFEDIKNILDTAYMPHLKLLDYTLHEGGDITLYTHAPNGLKVIKGLAAYYKIEYKDSTAKDLANTIDAINAKFKELFKVKEKADTNAPIDEKNKESCKDKEQADTIVPINERSKESFEDKEQVRAVLRLFNPNMKVENVDATKYPFYSLIWNRLTRNKPIEAQYADQEAVAEHNGYHIRYVHGHDGNMKQLTEKLKHIINLNDTCGQRTYSCPELEARSRGRGNVSEFEELMSYYADRKVSFALKTDLNDKQNPSPSKFIL